MEYQRTLDVDFVVVSTVKELDVALPAPRLEVTDRACEEEPTQHLSSVVSLIVCWLAPEPLASEIVRDELALSDIAGRH